MQLSSSHPTHASGIVYRTARAELLQGRQSAENKSRLSRAPQQTIGAATRASSQVLSSFGDFHPKEQGPSGSVSCREHWAPLPSPFAQQGEPTRGNSGRVASCRYPGRAASEAGSDSPTHTEKVKAKLGCSQTNSSALAKQHPQTLCDVEKVGRRDGNSHPVSGNACTCTCTCTCTRTNILSSTHRWLAVVLLPCVQRMEGEVQLIALAASHLPSSLR